MKYLWMMIFCLALVNKVNAQKVQSIDYEQFKQRLSNDSDTTYVLNFWATWCKPCVEEMPIFKEFESKNSHQKLKIILVSMDFLKDIEVVKQFVVSKNLTAEILLLTETDANLWINDFEAKWSGSIPATFVINKKLNRRKFSEKQLSLPELEELVRAVRL